MVSPVKEKEGLQESRGSSISFPPRSVWRTQRLCLRRKTCRVPWEPPFSGLLSSARPIHATWNCRRLV